MSTLTDTAREAADAFESFTRDGDEATRYRVSDDAPEWVRDLAREAHGMDMLPDDWRYECVYDALRYIADNGDDGDVYIDELSYDFADGHVDVYNAARTEWLGSHSMRAGYVDQARDEGLIAEDADVMDRIGVGQYLESREVFECVLEAVREYAEDEDEDEDEDELTLVPGATPRYDDDGNKIVEVMTCGHCGRSWNDAAISSVTPVPSGRCPFEYEHEYTDEERGQ